MESTCAMWVKFGETEMCGDLAHLYRQDHIIQAVRGVQEAIEKRSNTEIRTAERLTDAFQKNVAKELKESSNELDYDKHQQAALR